MLNSLSNDLSKLIFDAEDYDYNVIIKVGKSPNISRFKAHSCILRSRSPYFYSALSKNWAKKEGDVIIFEKQNITSHVFKIILSYIYSGQISLEQEHPKTVLDLLSAADELIIPELINYVQVYLLENHIEWIRKYPLQILHHTAFRLETCKKLQDVCLKVICTNPELIFGTMEFTKLEESMLIAILERDDLQLDEVDLWDYVIQWGIDHTFSADRMPIDYQWSQNDLLDLDETLKNCIPLLRFNYIKSKELPFKLKPFDILLPKHDSENINLCEKNYNEGELHVKTNDKQNLNYSPIDSNIIKLKHASLIAHWIDNQDDTNIRVSRNYPTYDFKLLLRGSLNGFSASKFHDLCDDKGATVVVMKVSDTGEIIGGYNPISWKGGFIGSWENARDSFIFSLGDGENNSIDSTKFYKVKQEHANMAVFCADIRGPCFGCRDLWMSNFNNLSINCDSEVKYYSGKILESKKFSVEDYEVFQVVKKNE
ncbi:14962_t:CDS:2 [Funneliformis geosporum]|nr:14962_t:CDS:2 [Funneliformis geosporum]